MWLWKDSVVMLEGTEACRVVCWKTPCPSALCSRQMMTAKIFLLYFPIEYSPQQVDLKYMFISLLKNFKFFQKEL